MKRIGFFSAVGLALLCLASPCQAEDTRYYVGPGPKSMSSAERALEPGSRGGSEHGIYIAYETHADDSYGAGGRVRRHIRAKIFSNEARDIGNIEIELRPEEKLSDWWGRTILPDGTVLELEESQIRTEDMVRAGRYAYRVVKAALPGIVPGAVVDFGYETISESLSETRRVSLQRRWPIVKFRYRWDRSRFLPSAMLTRNTEGLDFKRTDGRNSILLSASNVDAIKEEPRMPPLSRLRGYAILFYIRNKGDAGKNFWKRQAVLIDRSTRKSRGEEAAEIVSGFEFSADTPLPDKLATAYDWVLTNVPNPRVAIQGGNVKLTRRQLSQSINVRYIQIARLLGAEGYMVLLPDQPGGEWLPEYQKLSQFSGRVVSLHDPAPGNDWSLIVDPASGLPFGEVRLNAAGAVGFLAHPKNPVGMTVPPGVAAANITRSTGEIRFTEGGAHRDEEWTRVAEGQAGWVEAQNMARFDEDDMELLEAMCGAGPDVAVIESTHDVAYPPLRAQLNCKAQTSFGTIADEIDSMEIGIGGAWFKRLPDLPPGERTHDMILPFGSVDVAEIRVYPPEGFTTTDPPEDTTIASDFGKYDLTIVENSGSYKVNRSLALLNPTIPAKEYQAFRDFALSVEDADHLAVTFVKVGE